jgi:hypothetical protein
MFARREDAMRADEREPDEDDLDDEELDDGDQGEEVLNLAWDSGGPWAGAGTVCVRKDGPEYRAVYPDSGETTGPYESLAEAVANSGIGELTSACHSLRYRRGEIRLKELLDALRPGEGQRIDINGTPWRYGEGRWRRGRG